MPGSDQLDARSNVCPPKIEYIRIKSHCNFCEVGMSDVMVSTRWTSGFKHRLLHSILFAFVFQRPLFEELCFITRRMTISSVASC